MTVWAPTVLVVVASALDGQAPSRQASAPAAATQMLQRYVVASVANVRPAAAPSGAVHVRLRINTAVSVHASDSGWSHVSWQVADYVVRSGFRPEGFVRSDLLGVHAVGLDDALGRARRASRAGSRQRALLWAERAFAIDGLNAEAAALLRAAYRAAGEPKKATRLDRMLSGQAPAFLAICHAGRVQLMARSDPGGGLRRAGPDPGGDRMPVARELGGAAWYSLTPQGDQDSVSAGEFAGASYVSLLDRLPPRLALPDEGERHLVLASCDRDGTLYATSPLSRASGPTDVRDPRTREAFESLRSARRAGVGVERGLWWGRLGRSMLAVSIREGVGSVITRDHATIFRLDPHGEVKLLERDCGPWVPRGSRSASSATTPPGAPGVTLGTAVLATFFTPVGFAALIGVGILGMAGRLGVAGSSPAWRRAGRLAALSLALASTAQALVFWFGWQARGASLDAWSLVPGVVAVLGGVALLGWIVVLFQLWDAVARSPGRGRRDQSP